MSLMSWWKKLSHSLMMRAWMLLYFHKRGVWGHPNYWWVCDYNMMWRWSEADDLFKATYIVFKVYIWSVHALKAVANTTVYCLRYRRNCLRNNICSLKENKKILQLMKTNSFHVSSIQSQENLSFHQQPSDETTRILHESKDGRWNMDWFHNRNTDIFILLQMFIYQYEFFSTN